MSTATDTDQCANPTARRATRPSVRSSAPVRPSRGPSAVNGPFSVRRSRACRRPGRACRGWPSRPASRSRLLYLRLPSLMTRRRRRAATLDLTTVLTTTVTTVAIPATPPTRSFAADLAWSRHLPGPGSLGVRRRLTPVQQIAPKSISRRHPAPALSQVVTARWERNDSVGDAAGRFPLFSGRSALGLDTGNHSMSCGGTRGFPYPQRFEPK